jgi:uncharacterized SAM-binding protein YcdF (DUF218 family)
MFPYVTRIFWIVAQPISLIALLLVIGLLLLWLQRRRLASAALVLSLALLVVFCFTTVSYLLIDPLEARFTRPAEPARIDGIVVLGGGMETDIATVRQNWELNGSGDRFVETLRLALRHPEARILIAGGGSALAAGLDSEAEAGARFFRAFGITPERLLLEEKSRNTEENAVNAKAVGKPQPDETWLLVTSAFHMPRSVGLFRRAGFAVIPWPADYLGSGQEGIGLKFDEVPENLSVGSTATREWLGLLGYYLTGRIDELLPGPAPLP